jgi:hypothetical protein
MRTPALQAIVRGCTVTALAAAAVLPFASCANNDPGRVTKANQGKIYAVTADKTAFYRFGPQQDTPPDQELPKDTLVTLVRPSFGYAQVTLVEGNLQGYVASSDIRPAPDTLLAALNPETSETSSRSSYRENFDTGSSEPPPPEVLPDPDLPPASEEPTP